MTLICVASPKGGVGKTMVAAHLADELRRAGASEVIAIDLDPQNALRLHFGVPVAHRFGLSGCIGSHLPWQDAAIRTSSDILLFPFGSQPLHARAEFDHVIRNRPDLIVSEIGALARQPETVVIVDTSPGYSVALSSILPLADIVLSVMTAEASCISLVPEIHSASCYGISAAKAARFDHRVVVNRFDPLNRVSAMAMPQIVRRFGTMHLGTICRDEHVGEAFASQRLVQHYAPYSRAAADIELVGTRLIQTINGLQ
ncbi:cellulose synthase operon protein YhjQ/BcsQ [Asaia lannensis]|uniref:AAA family ATPase n=1 Tax=Asaia lannensis NBRC 102526 TaxID=1307926 RepID=A0ABT1CJC6_9PROT|nr:cellulose synthase operon protein YhjQ/BcsQ [Asaia lannensis]MCO6160962.1 AAA family ATPase [Asaia lannensis NBRC 102526]